MSLHKVAEIFQKRFALAAKFLFQLLRAIAIAARPQFGPGFVPAVAARMRVLDAEQIKIFLPVTALLRERRITKTIECNSDLDFPDFNFAFTR